MKTIRVFLVDDSATSRLLLRRLIQHAPDMEVVGEAANGRAAVRDITHSRPDIVLMDVVMPVMDGLTATREIMSSVPVPIVIVSELVGQDAALNFKALEAGALEVIRKPTLDVLDQDIHRTRFLRSVRIWAGVPVVTRRRAVRGNPEVRPPVISKPAPGFATSLVCIGASTGGPPAVQSILTTFARMGAPWPVLIVQHIATGFTEGLVRWLRDTTGFPVCMAEPGLLPKPGTAYVAPDNRHMILRASGLALLDDDPCRGHRPSVDVLFASVARSVHASRTVGILLTGMGEDGARGLKELRDAGAWTIAQDEASSVVYGMPKVGAALGGACDILPLHQIAAHTIGLGTGRLRGAGPGTGGRGVTVA